MEHLYKMISLKTSPLRNLYPGGSPALELEPLFQQPGTSVELVSPTKETEEGILFGSDDPKLDVDQDKHLYEEKTVTEDHSYRGTIKAVR